jgi:hypothetical protein
LVLARDGDRVLLVAGAGWPVAVELRDAGIEKKLSQ